jgi:ABC-type dipeptide/oligopeptide/nickel transport system permease subunit
MSVVSDRPIPTNQTRFSQRLKQFFGHPGALCGTVILVAFLLCAILAPWLAPFDPAETDIGARLAAPDDVTWFGADLFGRDILSRVIWGARYSLPVGFATLMIGLLLGGSLGILLGYVGGRIDAIGSRIIDVLLGFPAIVLAIMVVAVLGWGWSMW